MAVFVYVLFTSYCISFYFMYKFLHWASKVLGSTNKQQCYSILKRKWPLSSMGTMVKDSSYWINFTHYPHFFFQNWEFLHSLSLKEPAEKETHKEGDRSGSFTPGPILPTLGAVLHRVVKSYLGTLEFGARWGVMELERNVSQAQSPLGPACSTGALTRQSGGLVRPAPSLHWTRHHCPQPL